VVDELRHLHLGGKVIESATVTTARLALEGRRMIATVDGMWFWSRQCRNFAQSQSVARSRDAGANPGNNLHVVCGSVFIVGELVELTFFLFCQSNLSTRIEERDLEELFSKYGKVEKAFLSAFDMVSCDNDIFLPL
jgi:hypothetical protein